MSDEPVRKAEHPDLSKFAQFLIHYADYWKANGIWIKLFAAAIYIVVCVHFFSFNNSELSADIIQKGWIALGILFSAIFLIFAYGAVFISSWRGFTHPVLIFVIFIFTCVVFSFGFASIYLLVMFKIITVGWYHLLAWLLALWVLFVDWIFSKKYSDIFTEFKSASHTIALDIAIFGGLSFVAVYTHGFQPYIDGLHNHDISAGFAAGATSMQLILATLLFDVTLYEMKPDQPQSLEAGNE